MPKEITKRNLNLHCRGKKDRILFTMGYRNVQFISFFLFCLILMINKFHALSVISLSLFISMWKPIFFYFFTRHTQTLEICSALEYEKPNIMTKKNKAARNGPLKVVAKILLVG